MADRPSTSTSRAGRLKTKSVHQTPRVPVGKPKVGRPRSKSVHASKFTDSSKKPKGKKTPSRPTKHFKVAPPTEKRVIEIDSDNLEEIEFPLHQLELSDLPPMEVEQPNQVEQTSQGVNQPPAEEQPNQVPKSAIRCPCRRTNTIIRCPHGRT